MMCIDDVIYLHRSLITVAQYSCLYFEGHLTSAYA